MDQAPFYCDDNECTLSPSCPQNLDLSGFGQGVDKCLIPAFHQEARIKQKPGYLVGGIECSLVKHTFGLMRQIVLSQAAIPV
jgi:hypothetical protein